MTPSGNLTFAGWTTLAKIDRFVTNSPYAQVTQSFGQTQVSGGLRYMDLGAPRMRYYRTAGLPNVSYDDVWSFNPAENPRAAVRAKHYGELLPNVGVRHDFGSDWSATASYGRKFGRPDWGPQASNFTGNEAAFTARGITLQTLVDRVKPELSDQIDVSVRYRNGGLSVVPTLFFAKNQNRQVMVTDPALGGLSYYQGTSKTTQYGAELEAAYQAGESWAFFGSGTLASETFDDDTPTLGGGARLATRGRQIPNAPRVMLKGGLTYRQGGFAVSPIVRYIGKRYGDAVETQGVKAYALFDVSASYNLGGEVGIDTLAATLAVLNVFDKRYIGQIAVNDFNLGGATAYYAGAPRTVVGTLSMKF